MRGATLSLIAALTTILLLITIYDSAAQGEVYSQYSWALGIVVPEGADLAGGNKLQWGQVQNVTALIELPNVSRPDNIVYAVLSVMTSEGYVLQVAAGDFPYQANWKVYSWLFTDLSAPNVKYEWILNSSIPYMSPNDNVSMSIFRCENGTWSLEVDDISSGSYILQTFPLDIAPTLKLGNQEVFAFESYSRNVTTFESMGNLTLESLLFNGDKLQSGLYSYDSGWDRVRNPLFVIGTEGQIPPSFISEHNATGSLIVWTYSNGWAGQSVTLPGWLEVGLIGALLVVGIFTIYFITRTIVTERKKRFNLT